MGSPIVAVRSSAVDEDGASASFAGQHATVLGVNNPIDLVKAIHRCFTSLYEPRAIAYRLRQGIDITDVSIAVVIQTLVNPRSSGVMFTRDPNTGKSITVYRGGLWTRRIVGFRCYYSRPLRDNP